MKRIHVIIGLLIILLLLITFHSKSENAGSINSKNLSNEAVQNIASVYANTTGTAIFNNIQATGKITGKLDGDVIGNVTGNIKGDVTGNVTGNIKGNVDGDVSGNFIGKIYSSTYVTNVKDNNRYVFDVSEDKSFIIAPMKSDKSGWDSENGVKIIDSVIESRAIVGKIVPSAWNHTTFTEHAVKYFKQTDPDGTHITFVFRNSNNVWIISFIKLDNYIIGYRHQEHGNFKNGDIKWFREIGK